MSIYLKSRHPPANNGRQAKLPFFLLREGWVPWGGRKEVPGDPPEGEAVGPGQAAAVLPALHRARRLQEPHLEGAAR